MLAWRDLYFKRPEAIWIDENGQYVEPEPDEERIMLPIAMTTVEGFRELLLTKPPSISVPPPTVSGMDQVHADYNEKVLLSIWNWTNVYRRLCDSLWHGLVDGWGVLQVLWDKDADEGQCPVVVLHHDPYNVYPMPAARPDEWAYVIHTYPMLVSQVREDWMPSGGDKRQRKVRVAEAAFDGLKDTDTVRFVDYWDKDINAVAICVDKKDSSGSVIGLETRWIKEPLPHGYGFLPWEIYMPCRLPFRTVGEQMCVSILYSIEDTAVSLIRLLSQKATYLARWQDPPLVTRTEQGPDFEPIRTERGLQIRISPGEDAMYLVHPGPMPQIDTMAAQISEYQETAGLPRVLQGLYVGSVSGIAMSLLRNPTLMKVAFRQKEIEKAAEGLNAKILKLLEKKLSSPIYMWGEGATGDTFDVMIDPEKIAGYYRNEVKLSASLPTDDANTVNMLATMTQLGILSKSTTRDVAQRTLHDLVPQSLTDEEQRILAEQIWSDQGLIQSLAQAAAQKINLPYLKVQENPRGGYGEKEVTMPAGTLASQQGAMPGGNTQPNVMQRLQELSQGAPGPTGAVSKPEEQIQ